MMYNNKTDSVLTNRINTLFSEIASQASVSEKNKKGNLIKNCLFGSNVDRRFFLSNQIYRDLKRFTYEISWFVSKTKARLRTDEPL